MSVTEFSIVDFADIFPTKRQGEQILHMVTYLYKILIFNYFIISSNHKALHYSKRS